MLNTRKYLLVLAVLATSTTACTALPAPSTVANATVLDERIGIAATVGYTAASTLGNRLSRLGVIDRPTFQTLDAKGYIAVQAIRQAYLAGNSTSYLAAIEQAKAVTASIGSLVQ